MVGLRVTANGGLRAKPMAVFGLDLDRSVNPRFYIPGDSPIALVFRAKAIGETDRRNFRVHPSVCNLLILQVEPIGETDRRKRRVHRSAPEKRSANRSEIEHVSDRFCYRFLFAIASSPIPSGWRPLAGSPAG